MNKQTRPIFFLNKSEIKSAGILFYCQNKIMLLFDNKQLEDPGGKSEIVDHCPLDIAIRETKEEIGKMKYNKLMNNSKCIRIYIGKCKYLLHLKKVNKMRFNGMKVIDEHNGIERTIKWLNIFKLNRNQLCFRLNCVYPDIVKIIKNENIK